MAVRVDGKLLDATGYFEESDLHGRHGKLRQQRVGSRADLIKHTTYWGFYIDEPWEAPAKKHVR